MIDPQMSRNQTAEMLPESLTKLPAKTANAIIGTGLKATGKRVESPTSHREACKEEAKANQASRLKYRFFGVLCHRHLLSLNIPMLKGFVNGY